MVKNTLARIAVRGTEFECMADGMVGPLVLAFSMEDPGAAARLIRDAAKENDKLKVKLVALSGQLIPASEIDRVANLPTRDQAISMLMSVMQLRSPSSSVPSRRFRASWSAPLPPSVIKSKRRKTYGF